MPNKLNMSWINFSMGGLLNDDYY